MIGIDPVMFELFREEVKAHADTLASGLVSAEANPGDPTLLEALMRAAHSIKGAARIVNIDTAVRLAHVMEETLVAAQHGQIRLRAVDIDTLLKGADVLAGLAALAPETIAAWEAQNAATVSALEPQFESMAKGDAAPAPQAPPPVPQPVVVAPPAPPPEPPPAPPIAVAPSDPFPPLPAFVFPEIPAEPFALAAGHSMLDLFREEARAHLHTVARALPALPTDPTAAEPVLDALKQLRGAARLVKCEMVGTVASALSTFVRAAREGKAQLGASAQEWTKYAVAKLAGALATDDETFAGWAAESAPEFVRVAEAFGKATAAGGAPVPAKAPEAAPVPTVSAVPPPSQKLERETTEPAAQVGARPAAAIPEVKPVEPAPAPPPPAPAPPPPAPAEAVVRVAAQSLNRLMGLAGESLVQARWLPTFSTALLKLKKRQELLANALDNAFHAANAGASADQLLDLIADARKQWSACRTDLSAKTSDFDDHAARAEDLNARLYREVIASRMRPLADGIHGLPRLVRDMARSLGKEAKLVVHGDRTEVDRDILDKLESPLSHLVRNAVDHGLEPTDVRREAGKPAAGTITLEARHRAGMLHVTVSDDGGGIDLARLRKKIVERGLNSAELTARLTEAELLEFLFLPGFSTAAAVTEFSGRGVGLDVVMDTVRKVGGNVRVTTSAGKGTQFHMQLPLTLSVIRAVVVDVAGEPYAFPHNRINRLVRVRRDAVRSLEHRQFVNVDGANVGLVLAGQLLDIPAAAPQTEDLAVVLLSDGAGGEYGLIVDSFHGEQDLVVRPLDARLGKVPNLSAAAILDDGSPVLIVDVEDLLRSMDQFIQTGSLVRCETRPPGAGRRKRVLVVDDSITVREVERQLLLQKGYEVAVAVDGMDGWNKLRAVRYDLLVSDIDMPRMNGLQLVKAVRGDERLLDMPIIIVSYKEREEDRIKGLEVGANAYLTKSSFHDNRFMEAVTDLIGPAE
jgi:two-component system sensor histidine kinase and response regulator WspE